MCTFCFIRNHSGATPVVFMVMWMPARLLNADFFRLYFVNDAHSPTFERGQKCSAVKDPDRTSLPSKLPKTISVSFIKSSLHFTNILFYIFSVRITLLEGRQPSTLGVQIRSLNPPLRAFTPWAQTILTHRVPHAVRHPAFLDPMCTLQSYLWDKHLKWLRIGFWMRAFSR